MVNLVIRIVATTKWEESRMHTFGWLVLCTLHCIHVQSPFRLALNRTLISRTKEQCYFFWINFKVLLLLLLLFSSNFQFFFLPLTLSLSLLNNRITNHLDFIIHWTMSKLTIQIDAKVEIVQVVCDSHCTHTYSNLTFAPGLAACFSSLFFSLFRKGIITNARVFAINVEWIVVSLKCDVHQFSIQSC